MLTALAIAAIVALVAGTSSGGNKFFDVVNGRARFNAEGRRIALDAMKNMRITVSDPDGDLVLGQSELAPLLMIPEIGIPSAWDAARTMHAAGYNSWVPIDDYDRIWFRKPGDVRALPSNAGQLTDASKAWQE